MRKAILAAGAALAVISTAAMASVSFDYSTGTGFVGKGDVQLAFGWNNKAAQDNAKNVTFAVDAQDTYDVTCEWETVTGGPHSQTIFHDVTIPRHVKVNASVSYDARLKNQYTGYILNGYGTSTTVGSVPVVGASCPMAHATAVITEVALTSSNGGGLSVTWNGTTVPLPNTPVI
jgi:hypothetical protein